MDRTAVDEVAAQSLHSFSALMPVRQQLLKLTLKWQMSRYNGRIFMTAVVRQRQFFKWTGQL